MKKIIILLIGLIGLLLMMSCTRNDVADPQLFGPSSIDIILEGTASPSSLYIPEARNSQTSLISVKVTRYDGKPVTGKDVIFQQVIKNSTSYEGISWGYFDGTLLTSKKTTDANGNVTISYSVPGAYINYPNTNVTIYIWASLVDDSRQQISDWIPVNVYVYAI